MHKYELVGDNNNYYDCFNNIGIGNILLNSDVQFG